MMAFLNETNEKRKKELEEKFKSETLLDNLEIFNEKIAKSGSGFLASSGLSWADLHLMNVLEWLGEPAFAYFRSIREMYAKVRAQPNAAAWLAQRPKTDM